MAVILAIALVVTAAVIHYEVLWRLNRVLPKLRVYPRRASVLIAVLGAIVSHFLQIALFAAVFYLAQDSTSLSLVGQTGVLRFGDFLYFSMETYTSLGFGDVFPADSLRLLVGIESITGLLMISWTASFTYLEMQRFWVEPVR